MSPYDMGVDSLREQAVQALQLRSESPYLTVPWQGPHDYMPTQVEAWRIEAMAMLLLKQRLQALGLTLGAA